MFYKSGKGYNPETWIKTGCSYITPARISYHCIGGVDHYIENAAKIAFYREKKIDGTWRKSALTIIRRKKKIRTNSRFVKRRRRIRHVDFGAETPKFHWTGANAMSVVLFLLRHISKKGEANDNCVKDLDGITV